MLIGIWEDFLKIVKEEAGSRVVETWLKAVSLYQWDANSRVVYLVAPNSFVKDWVQTHYMQLLETHLGRLLNAQGLKVVFLDCSDKQEAVASNGGTEPNQTPVMMHPATVSRHDRKGTKKDRRSSVPISINHAHINQHYQFDSFVVGPNNSLAYAAAHAVTEKIGSLYNPLFIYGGSGLGKTHLLHAIGNELRRLDNGMNMVYQSTDRFVNEFISAIRFDKVHAFQKKYKSVDVLMIDDIQFISNKEQTQEALFHIFNFLHERQKQIIFTSDLFPRDIKGLAERLRSRLEWGLVADIHTPTLETKMAILKKKAAANDEHIEDDVLEFIASRGSTNVRELEGALIRVIAFASLTKQDISIGLAQRVLVRAAPVAQEPTDLSSVAKAICSFYSYRLEDLRSEKRSREITRARQVAMYMMKKLTTKSLREIGFFLKRKDHSTVLHAVNKIKKEVECDDELQQQIKKIEEAIY